jgi:hypothetical protein
MEVVMGLAVAVVVVLQSPAAGPRSIDVRTLLVDVQT